MESIKNYFYFHQIAMRSHSEKSGKVQNLYHRTLIDSTENTQGKSTFVKVLFWSVGCEVKFEDTWCEDLETIISFSVRNQDYQIYRNNHSINLYDIDRDKTFFFNIRQKKASKEFIEKFNEILNFNIKLSHPNTLKLSVVPPHYYFAINYIEQMTGWKDFWSCFPVLSSFNDKKRLDILKYISGILDHEYFLEKNNESSIKQKKEEISEKLVKYNSHLGYLIPYEEKGYYHQVEKTKLRIIEDQNEILEIRNKYLEESSNLNSIEKRIDLIKITLKELDLDYEYAVENTNRYEIDCPTCGVTHKNDIINRFSILKDVDVLEYKLLILEEDRKKLIYKLENLKKIILIKDQQINSELEKNDFLDHAYDNIISSRIVPKIKDNIKENEEIVKELDIEQRKSSKTQTQIQKFNLAKMQNNFVEKFQYLCNKLEVKETKKPLLSFKEIIQSDSTGANAIKLMLSKRLTVIDSMVKYAESSIPPFVIDSPRQQDMDDKNYQLILNSLFDDIPNDMQLIVAAVKSNPIYKLCDKFIEISIEYPILKESDYFEFEATAKSKSLFL